MKLFLGSAAAASIATVRPAVAEARDNPPPALDGSDLRRDLHDQLGRLAARVDRGSAQGQPP